MAQRRARGRGASRQQDSGTPQPFLRGYAAGLLSGLFVAFLLYLATLPAAESPPPEQPSAARQTATAPTPEYEFYEVLPRQKIDVEVDPAELPTQRSPDSAPRYLLQAGSFRQAEDADRRRAELLLLGLEPRVEETQGQNGRWYRVIIGPFESRSAMARARSLTAQQDIDTLLMQRKAG
ncbi:MAG: SPOR domain-containing protein [Pseudomonadota bacterium]